MPSSSKTLDILKELMVRAGFDWQNPEDVAEISNELGFPTEKQGTQIVELGIIEQWLQNGQLHDHYDPSILFNPADSANANILDRLAGYLTKTEAEKAIAHQQLHAALAQEYVAPKGVIAEILDGTRTPDINFARHAQ